MIFKQLFEPHSSTYTYLLGCETTGLAVLIDPVLETFDRDLDAVRELGLKLAFTLETHIHADHLTSARKLKAIAGSRIAAPKLDNLSCTDVPIEEGRAFHCGEITLHPLFTPGHTDTHHAYVLEQRGMRRLFSGDALLIEGCGRTDFQNGNSEALFHSVRQKLFALPDETLVYPAHDYHRRQVSSIGQEKMRNPRLALDKSLGDFVRIMAELNLPYPAKIQYAIPGNRECGKCPPNVPAEFRSACEIHDQG